MKKWKLNESTKDTLIAVGSIAAVIAVYVLIGCINPMLIASDGYVEFLDGF